MKRKNDLDYRSRIYERYRTNFQEAPATFSEQAALRWGHGYRYYLRNWLPANKDAAIVDVACGGGKLLYAFKSMQYRNVIGVDISSEQVKLARQVVSAVDEANALDWLEAHPSAFDLITGLDIIEHLYKPEILRFLDASYNGLKPGGRIILQTPNAESPSGGSIRYGDFTHEVGLTPKLLLQLLHLSGFQDVRVRETGPVPLGYSIASSMRFLIWQCLRVGLLLWNLAETGSAGSGIFTRIFLITGLKGSQRQSEND
jgi:2-polyprenyl-3-methyl-5-hydroxy-6-metoxy-1,4-benzoquinol methylase